jgi:hypothetical protein
MELPLAAVQREGPMTDYTISFTKKLVLWIETNRQRRADHEISRTLRVRH